MAVELNYQLVGKRLRAIRKKRGFTQEHLAELAGISPQHCSGIETGAAKVSLPALIQLCNALDTTPDAVLLDSVPATARPILLREVENVFADCSADEIYLMLSQAESLKKALRVKKLAYLSAE